MARMAGNAWRDQTKMALIPLTNHTLPTFGRWGRDVGDGEKSACGEGQAT